MHMTEKRHHNLSFSASNVAKHYAEGEGPSKIAWRYHRPVGFVRNYIKTPEFLEALAFVTAKKQAEVDEIREVADKFRPLVAARNRFVEAAPVAADRLVEMLEKDEDGKLKQDARLVKEVALDISKGLGVLKGESQSQPVVQISISDQKIAILEDSLRALREPIGELKPTEDR